MSYFLTAVGMVLSTALLSFLNKKANEEDKINPNIHSLSKIYKIMGGVLILISILALILPQLMDNPPQSYPLIMWLMILIFFGFGIYTIKLQEVHKIINKRNSFIVVATIGKEKEFNFNEIISVKLNYITYFISIKDKKGQTVKVYFHLRKLITILERIKNDSSIEIVKIDRTLGL